MIRSQVKRHSPGPLHLSEIGLHLPVQTAVVKARNANCLPPISTKSLCHNVDGTSKFKTPKTKELGKTLSNHLYLYRKEQLVRQTYKQRETRRLSLKQRREIPPRCLRRRWLFRGSQPLMSFSRWKIGRSRLGAFVKKARIRLIVSWKGLPSLL